jgi:hypothetical protein
MGMMDNMKDKAQDAAGQHGDKIDQGIDKAGEQAKQKAGDEHGEQIDQGAERAKDAVEDFGR